MAAEILLGMYRMLTTVLFVDMVCATARLVALGDRRWRELLAQYTARVRQSAGRAALGTMSPAGIFTYGQSLRMSSARKRLTSLVPARGGWR